MSQRVVNNAASPAALSFLERSTVKYFFLQKQEEKDEKTGKQKVDEKTGKKQFEYCPWLYMPIIAAIGGMLGAIFSLINVTALGATYLYRKSVQYFKPGTYTQEALQRNRDLLLTNTTVFMGYSVWAVVGGSGFAVISTILVVVITVILLLVKYLISVVHRKLTMKTNPVVSSSP